MTTIWFSTLNSDEKDIQESPFSPFAINSKPLFGNPKEIGHFSIDSSRNIHFDQSKMRYLTFPTKHQEIYMDLNINFTEDYNHQYVTIDKMRQLQYWILQNKEVVNNLSPKK